MTSARPGNGYVGGQTGGATGPKTMFSSAEHIHYNIHYAKIDFLIVMHFQLRIFLKLHQLESRIFLQKLQKLTHLENNHNKKTAKFLMPSCSAEYSCTSDI